MRQHEATILYFGINDASLSIKDCCIVVIGFEDLLRFFVTHLVLLRKFFDNVLPQLKAL